MERLLISPPETCGAIGGGVGLESRLIPPLVFGKGKGKIGDDVKDKPKTETRFPSMLPVPESTFCWLYPERIWDGRYEKVDWETVTPEEMEQWRLLFAKTLK